MIREIPSISADETQTDNIGLRFIGLSGGEIFHEMMLRQGVKHICKLSFNQIVQDHISWASRLTFVSQLAILVVQSFLFSMLSTIQNISSLFYQNMSKEPATWLKVMHVLRENQALYL